MELMSAKFTDSNTARKLAASITEVVNAFLKGQIYDKLPSGMQPRLSVSLIDKYPLYSAYRFDNREFWYIPYHYRNDHQTTPVFIFRKGFEATEIYKDFDALLSEVSPHHLSALLTVAAQKGKAVQPGV